jgi:hypothetical protein
MEEESTASSALIPFPQRSSMSFTAVVRRTVGSKLATRTSH